MKRYLIFALVLVSACKENTRTDTTANQLPTSIVNNPHTANGIDTVAAAMKPTMDFQDTIHDFGNIHHDEVVTHEFSFTNNGKTPLLITSASGSCGCTVPEYPKEAVAPGKSGSIKVTFNSAGKKDHQEKSVTIHTNTLRNVEMLFIKANILDK